MQSHRLGRCRDKGLPFPPGELSFLSVLGRTQVIGLGQGCRASHSLCYHHPTYPSPDPAQPGESSRPWGPEAEPGSMQRQPQRMGLACFFLGRWFHLSAMLSRHGSIESLIFQFLEQMGPSFHTAPSDVFQPHSKLLLLREWCEDRGIGIAGRLWVTQKLRSTWTHWIWISNVPRWCTCTVELTRTRLVYAR